MALIYVVQGVLLLVEWAFSLDLLNKAMGGVRRTLVVLHDRVLGEPWFLAALSVTAPLAAHHGDAGRYDETPFIITGTLVEIKLTNPHSIVVFDATANIRRCASSS